MIRRAPNITAIAVAATSLFVTLGGVLAIAYISSGFKAVVAQKRLLKTAEEKGWDSEAIARDLDQTVFYYWYREVLGKLTHGSRHLPVRFRYELKEAIDSLYNDSPEGVRRTERLIGELELRPEYAALLQIDSTPAQHLLKAKNSFTGFAEVTSLSDKATLELEALAENERSLIAQHAVLGRALSELFSLPTEYDRVGQNGLLMYEKGIMAGLPKVTGIPDEAADAVALQSMIKRAGGTLNIEEGPDTPLLLLGKLKNLGLVSDKIRDNYNVLSGKKRAVEEVRREAEIKIRKICAELREQNVQLLMLLWPSSPAFERLL